MNEETKSLIAGSISGGLALIVYNPVEVLKCRAQVNRVSNFNYSSELVKLWQREGFFGGVYKGMFSLLMRDVPGWGVYFSCYEILKKAFNMDDAKRDGNDYSSLNMMIKMWCAGVAGQASWVVSYPADIIKTQIQCNADRRVTIREVSARIY